MSKVAQDLVSTLEAADILQRPVATINRWANRGTLPIAVRGNGIRGARMFRREDVERVARERVAS